MKASDLPKLAAPFPKEDIHWRAQTIRKMSADHKALALAYLDARDVMERLDQVCGPEGWQTKHADMSGGRAACHLGIIVDGTWIWKSDGAGATDVEGDKGAFSDSLKRAAVAWGIGRYLYDLGTTWVPCTTYTGKDGKERFKEFKSDPWTCVKGNGKVTWHGPLGKQQLTDEMRALSRRMDPNKLITTGDLDAVVDEYTDVIGQAQRDLPDWWRGYSSKYQELQGKLQSGPAQATEAAE